jgi:hypothetical protein
LDISKAKWGEQKLKFLKTFLGLFCALYFPLMFMVAVVMRPRDTKVTAWQAAIGAALPFGLLILAISLGFAILTTFMDKEKARQEGEKDS